MTLLETYEEAHQVIKQSGSKLVEEVLKATGHKLPAREIDALLHIWLHEAKGVQPTPSMIAEELDVSLPQITALYDSLKKKKLAAPSIRFADDKRVRLLATTKKGAEVAAVVEGL